MSAAWFPQATRRDGPSNKFGYPTSNPTDKYGHKKGTIYHSSEGTLATWWNILDNQVPPRKSATFFNPKVSKLYQHYPVDAHTWANGTKAANKGYVSCENEGVAGEPLTDSQVDNLVGLTAWLKERFGWAELSRSTTMREHNEFTPTACPSGRIPWAEIIRRAEEEDDMALILARKDGDNKVYVTDWLWKRHVTRAERNAFLALDVPFLNPVPAFMEELLDNVQETARLDPAWTGALAAHGADPDAHHE